MARTEQATASATTAIARRPGDVPPQAYLTYPTWLKYVVISSNMQRLQVRDKRILFHALRDEADHDVFFPAFGFTGGLFCVWQILMDVKRPRKRDGDAAATTGAQGIQRDE